MKQATLDLLVPITGVVFVVLGIAMAFASCHNSYQESVRACIRAGKTVTEHGACQ